MYNLMDILESVKPLQGSVLLPQPVLHPSSHLVHGTEMETIAMGPQKYPDPYSVTGMNPYSYPSYMDVPYPYGFSIPYACPSHGGYCCQQY